MPSLDVFNNDAFSWTSLTAAVNKLPFKPGRLGALGLFGPARGVTTTTVYIDEKTGRLSLVQTSPRGAPAGVVGATSRTARPFRVPHLKQDSAVYADEVQNVRAFGSESEVATIEQLVNDRMGEMRGNIEVTHEFHKMGAVKGLILDADGSTLFNLFTEFGVAQQEVELDFGGDPDPEVDLRNQMVAAKRLSEAEMGGLLVERYHGFTGPDFFDALVAHESVKRAWDTQQGARLGEDLRVVGFPWAGVTWEEYRGSVAPQAGGAAVKFVEDDEAWLVPIADIFLTRFAPGDYEETVNTPGLPFYAKQAPDPSGFNRLRALEVQSSPLFLNTRPRAVIKLTMTGAD